MAAVTAKSHSKVNYIDRTGQVVIPDMTCDMAGPFTNGPAWISRPGGKFGYINRCGEFVWEPQV